MSIAGTKHPGRLNTATQTQSGKVHDDDDDGDDDVEDDGDKDDDDDDYVF